MDWILPLDHITLTHIDQTGGKAARLGALMRAGFPVPDGFVITADAFLLHHPIFLDTRPPPPRLSPEFIKSLADAFQAYFAPGERVAVRSSGVDEDGQGASFAGQHATYYYIDAATLEQAVVDCWMSLWSPPALAYRASRDKPIRPMAVIVQKLVDARRSGVCFSRDPLDPRAGTVVIEASWGLGAALVDGRVQPDRLRVDDRGAVTLLQLGDKRERVAATRADPSMGRLEAVPEHLRTARVLTDDDAFQLHEITEQIETLFGEPVDVEWAYDADTLHILQARPITTLTTGEPAPVGPMVLFKPLAENFTEPLTPLTVSLMQAVIPPGSTFVDGRLYVGFAALRRFMPLKLTDAECVDLLLLRRMPDPMVPHPGRLALLLAGLGVVWLSQGAFWSRSARLMPQALERFPPWLEGVARQTGNDPVRFMRATMFGAPPFAPVWRDVLALNISAGRYFLPMGLARQLLRRWAPSLDPDLLADLVHDESDMWSRRMLDAVRELASLANAHPDAQKALRAGDCLTQVRLLPQDHPFVVGLGDFLRTYGHRGPREMDLASPRWREDPTPVLIMIRNQLSLPEAGSNAAYAQHLVARDKLRRQLGNGLKARCINRLVSRIRYYIALRENTRHYHTMLFDRLRRKLTSLEHDLLLAEKIKTAGDLFFLTWPEVRSLQAADQPSVALAGVIRERRIAHQRLARTRPPETLNLHLAHALMPDEDANVLYGQRASSGEAEGVARVVLHPDQAGHIQPGDILIAPYTDPTWTPLFPSLAGIVVGMGSYLSHAGTIARELRIPCLVDVRDCVSRIRDGQRVRLCADLGFVQLVDGP
ncbi:MAG: PEP/pyruvate-binding domain-containing protein [Pseudomonadales bacterium]